MSDIDLNLAIYSLDIVSLVALVEVWMNIRLARRALYFLIHRERPRKIWRWMLVGVFLVAGMAGLWAQLYLLARLSQV
jgi:hypothetical protein